LPQNILDEVGDADTLQRSDASSGQQSTRMDTSIDVEQERGESSTSTSLARDESQKLNISDANTSTISTDTSWQASDQGNWRS
jgi:hypothetical protein